MEGRVGRKDGRKERIERRDVRDRGKGGMEG